MILLLSDEKGRKLCQIYMSKTCMHFVFVDCLTCITTSHIILSTSTALLPYIDEDQIHLLPLDATPGNHSTILSPSQFARQPHSDSDGQETKQSDASREISTVIPTDSIKR